MMFNTGDLILDAIILSIVARTPEGTYGYKITQEVRSKMDVPESAFYPLLKQMQMEGYLEVYHKDLGGRSRRFYKITESGRERLEFCQQNWTNYLQNANSLLMSGIPQAAESQPQVQASAMQMQPQAPVMQAQPQVSVMQPQASVQEQAVSTAASDNFDFSIGEDAPASPTGDTISQESDLFEFESFPTAPAPAAYAEPTVQTEPVTITEPTVQPEPVTMVEPVTYENIVSYEEAVPNNTAVPETVPADDEDDFLAEMAMGEAEAETLQEEEAVVPDTVFPEDGIENTFSESAEISELEDLIAQLRSFESVMSHRPATESSAEASPVSSGMAIKDVSGVASLLNTAPAPAPAPAQPVSQSTPAKEADSTHTTNIRYKEVRNPETDDSVNSLVDLLKDDQPKKKSRFFKGWGNKKSSDAAQFMASESDLISSQEPAPAKVTKDVSAESAPAAMPHQEIRNTENNNISRSSNSNAGNTPAAVKKTVSSQPVAAKVPEDVPPTPVRSSIRKVDNNNSVDSLVELLKDDKTETKHVSIFGKASSKSLTKVDSQKAVSQPAKDTAIPKPSVSEPKVFKPTASKTFEEKAASPNARPVETTATITKSLDAKAISTKPAVAKPAEAKAVETKAVVTPKAETAPAANAETKQDMDSMDSFKARLMQAHLIPEDK